MVFLIKALNPNPKTWKSISIFTSYIHDVQEMVSCLLPTHIFHAFVLYN